MKRSLPPIPKSITNKYQSKRPNNNPADHQGRARTVPHVEGNWASYVYIEVPISEEFQKCLDDLKKSAKDFFSEKHSTDENVIFDYFSGEESCLRISLSRTVYLKWAHIDKFKELVAEVASKIPEFDVMFSDLVCFDNEEKTRSFLSLDVFPSPEGPLVLRNLIKRVDEIMKRFNLPQFYQPPHFHSSILWTKPPKRITKELCDRLNEECKSAQDLQSFSFSIDKIFYKIGNKTYSADLL